MQKAIFPGTFDPITNGHIDIIRRGADLFDKLYVVLSKNITKTTLFDHDQRLAQVEMAVSDLANVEVVISDAKLTVELAQALDATAILRGVRDTADFEYEFRLAQINKKLAPIVETIFLTSDNEHLILSSSMVKEIAKFNGDVTPFVPVHIATALVAKFND